MTPNKLPLVLVEWLDAWTETEPTSIETVGMSHKPERVVTLGWVLLDNEAGIQLSTELFDGNYRGRTFIPKAMVVSVTPYHLTRTRKPKSQPEEVKGCTT